MHNHFPQWVAKRASWLLGLTATLTLVALAQLIDPWNDSPAPEPLEQIRANPTDSILSRLANPGLILVMHRGLRAATVTIEKSFAHVLRLYEQGADPIRIGQYVQRWRKWITSGLGRLSVTCDDVGVDCIPPSRSRKMPAL